MNNSQKPVARQDGLVIQEMPDEILVFDLESNKAHCLNQTAAFVWKSCDGKNSVAEIARLFGDESGKPVQEDLIWLAIDQLNDNHLLAENLKADFKNQTRREVIKKVGLAAVIALPLVSSLLAPTSVLAVGCSGGGQGSPCAGGACCNNVCCPGLGTGIPSLCTGTGGGCPGTRPIKGSTRL